MSPALLLVGTLVAASVLVAGHTRRTGTTLVAVSVWTFVTLATLCVSGLLLLSPEATNSTAVANAVRWIAACSTFCPMMAQLGAKRPQDRGWQWIVLSLWVILALPAGEALLLGRSVQISTMRWAFAWSLVAIGLLNMLPTRYWLSALLVAAGQSVLLLSHRDAVAGGAAIGMSLFATAAIVAWWSARRTRNAATSLDRAWLDFRDMFGAVWALRIAEQLNKASTVSGWNVAARWDGFFDATSGDRATDLPQATADEIEQSLRTQLRRFVSPAWLDARLPMASDETDAA